LERLGDVPLLAERDLARESSAEPTTMRNSTLARPCSQA